MANRRQVIQSGLVLAATPLFVFAAPAAFADGAPAGLRLERFVFDSRFAEARSAAAGMARRGVRLAATEGDLTDLWRDDLNRAWKAAPMTLAGMTTRGGVFVLETLAADHRMGVVHREEYPPARSERAPQRDEPLFSWIIAPRAAVARSA